MTTHTIAANLNPRVTLTHHSKTKILGHRGARGERLENSQAGFLHSQALQQQAPQHFVGIEFDVQLTKDGQLIVFHDDDLLRLYQLQIRVDQMTYQAILRLTALTYPILRLEDMALFLSGYSRIELEIKTHPRTRYHVLIAALARTLTLPNFAAAPIVLTSFDDALLQRLQAHKILSTFGRGLLVAPVISNTVNNNPRLIGVTNTANDAENDAENTANVSIAGTTNVYQVPYIAARLGCTGVGLYYPLYDQKMMALCQRLGLTTSAWTVNSSLEVERLAHLGVDYIITDYPVRFLP